jgi:hypothetical protein
MAVEKHVKAVAKMTGANVFVANVGVGDAALIEDVANPADGVGVRPGDPKADARNGGGVMRDAGRRSGADKVQTKFIGDGMKRAGESILGGLYPGARGKVSAARSEGPLRDLHFKGS